jgi:hypothetical protein
MKRANPIIPCFIVLVLAGQAHSQVNENFLDGDFTSNPTWYGDVNKFTAASTELWLNAPAVADVAFLSTPSSTLLNAEWQFYNRMEFNPSSANFCRFYLVSDQKNLNATNMNGYYVELGRLADEISLYKTVNGVSTRIIDGPDDMLNSAICHTRVKVTRTGNVWELWADSTGGLGFVSLGSVADSAVNETYFLGAYCKYTATRSDKFFFDEVVATGTLWPDIAPPAMLDYTLGMMNTLELSLSEPVTQADLIPANFTLDNGLTVTQVAEDSLDAKKIKITASGNFLPDSIYHLHIGALHDFAGNLSGGVSQIFALHTAVPGEIIINEIMADPTPGVGLPNAEYIELYNQSIYPMNLRNWEIKIGNVLKTLPFYTLLPGEFLVLLDVNDTALFGTSIPKLGMISLPGLANAGASILLADTGGVPIDELAYNLSWYHDADKEGGGFSLERVNPGDLCLVADNWRASNAFNGGTPGTQNSVWDTSWVELGAHSVWIDSVHLLLVFNKQLDSAGFILSNFNLQNLASIQTLSTDSCILVLSGPLTANTPFLLTISMVLDCNQQFISSPLIMQVVNYQPQLFDVLIDELMIDETPPIGLPAAEYMEIKNMQPFPLNLAGFTLHVNTDLYTLGNLTIPADSFIVLTDDNNLGLFTGLNTGGIFAFSGLNNEEGIISLFHANGSLLHAVHYSNAYYDAPGKENGGWSLEMIDTSKPCLQNINWTASLDVSGGTPGRRNSYSTDVADTHQPHVLKTGIETSSQVLILYFDESILPNSFTLADLSLTNGTALNLAYSSTLLDEYKVLLQDPLMADSTYYISLNGLSDCEGNPMVADSLPYSIPVTPANFDLIINEVLADPLSGCIDYVEIYNRGEAAVDLSQLNMGEGDTSTHLLTSYAPVYTQSVLLHPGEYLLISEDHEKIMDCYFFRDSTSYWDISSLPDFSNASGVVGISTTGQQWIDMFAYNEDMHLGMLNSTDGVALERIDPSAPTQNSMNWHSAATTVGYGTPGYQNSQFLPGVLVADQFELTPEIISPDNDGYKDYLQIYYTFDQPGYTASLKIFDQAGRLEKDLVNNELLGTSGSFLWDGSNNEGAKVNVGIHIIYFEVVGVQGEVISFKKPVVVAAKM